MDRYLRIFRQAGVEGMQGRRRIRGGKEAGAQWGLSRADGRSGPEGRLGSSGGLGGALCGGQCGH